MLIGIDGNEANSRNRVGVGEFAFGVINGLYKLDKKNQYQIYLKGSPLPDFPKVRINWRYKIFGPSFAWTQWRLPLKLYTEMPRVGVFFSPNHYAPRFCPVPSVISIMDLWHHRHPEQFRQKDLYQLIRWEAYSMRQAKKIIAISEFTKEEIIKLYQVQAERIVVAYPGLNKFQIPNSKFETNSKFKIQNIKTKYGIKDDYLLYLGTLQPKKNLIHLIEAFYILYTKYKILNTSLVVAGKKGWLYEQVFEKVKELRVESKVVFTDYVPEEDKYRLVAGSQCFILPSLYEGFGIPVLEAMAIGVPVAISNVSSLPEVGGEAAFYFDPEKPQSIAQTIADVLKLSPSERVAVAQKGKTQAEKFTWEKCARTILDTLEQLAISN
jgi:glycosyltransferase involved in cell wall biosynthesis